MGSCLSSNRSQERLPNQISTPAVEEPHYEALKEVSINDLPDHFLVEAFSYFRIRLLIQNCAPVNRRWWRLVQTRHLWNRLDVSIPNKDAFDLSLKIKLQEVADEVTHLRLWVERPFLEDVVSSICVLPNVVELSLCSTHGLDENMVDRIVPKFPAVHAANLDSCYPLDNDGLEKFVSGWHNLTDLNISNCSMIDRMGLQNFILAARNIRSLHLTKLGGNLTDGCIRGLVDRHGSTLQSLSVSGVQLTDSAVIDLSEKPLVLRNLTILQATRLTNISMISITEFVNLRHLHLANLEQVSQSEMMELFGPNHFHFLSCLNLTECRCMTDQLV